RADLVDAARRHDWSKLPEMLEYITDNKRDEIFATSLVRLVPASGDSKILPALLKASSDPSPLVRSAAAESMQNIPEIDAVNSLIKMTGDSSRLVRVRAAGALVKHKGVALKSSESKTVESASREFLGSLVARSDQWDSHYNLGNYYLDCGQVGKAIASYNEALRIEPDAVPAMVNSAMAYVRLGEKQKADEMLERALTTAPANAEANFNMGLLKAEENDTAAAEKFLRTALRIDPTMAQAAYNLGVLISGNDINEAVNLCKKAVELRPNEPRFAYTLAFYQIQKGDLVEAAHELESMILKFPDYADTYLLLGNIYEKQGRTGEAEKLYNSGILGGRISYHYQAIMKNRLEKLGSSPRQ
ncbi:MAG: tetratricopeptide repeat protein, partial [Desulfomonilaceae bacterium]